MQISHLLILRKLNCVQGLGKLFTEILHWFKYNIVMNEINVMMSGFSPSHGNTCLRK